MPDITLKAETGRTTGSGASRRLRAAGKIPAVVYGHGRDPLSCAVDGREFRHAMHTDAGLNALLTLDLGGEQTLALAKEIQRHPVRNTVTHVDFIVVGRNEVVTSDVPVVLVGEATGVTGNDGVVDQVLFSLPVNAPVSAIPNQIEVDISGLKIGESIRIADLDLPTGSSTDLDPEEAVVVGGGASLAAEAEEIAAADEEQAEAQSAIDTAAHAEGAAEGGEGGLTEGDIQAAAGDTAGE